MASDLKQTMVGEEPLEFDERYEVDINSINSHSEHLALQAKTSSAFGIGRPKPAHSPRSGGYPEMSSTKFAHNKKMALKGADFSKKGSIDAPIVELIELVNSNSHYFTTSSCSGRTIVVSESSSSGVKKKGCQWLYVTHDVADPIALMKCLKDETVSSAATLKFEPMIMHVQCASSESARHLMQIAVASGFRNSGLSLGKSGKIILAVRSTAGLEVPLRDGGKLLVTDQYVEYLVELANEKMKSNLLQISRFFNNLQQMLKTNEFPRAKVIKNHRKKTENSNEAERHGVDKTIASGDQAVESVFSLFDPS